jgi:ketosteroid isomerase-like protein
MTNLFLFQIEQAVTKGRKPMKQFVSILAASLLLTYTATAKDPPATEDKIAGFETALGQAMIHKDIATLTNLVADDWTIQSSSGAMGTKDGFINDVKSGKLVVTSFKIHDVHVRVLGDVAFVQAFDDETSFYEGKENSGTYNWLDVWQKRDGHWVSVATQLTKVEPQK